MSRYAAFVFLLSLGLVSQRSNAIEVKVKDGDKLCLYANLTLSFSVSYQVPENKSKTVSFELPDSVSSDASKCDDTSSILMLTFEDRHSWSVNFTQKDNTYQADVITFTYNLNDSHIFPNSSANGTVSVTVKPDIANIGLDTCYSCKSEDTIAASPEVNMTLSNVLIQAFVVNGTKSENLTSCAADLPKTTTAAPVTNKTTVAPTTNATTTVAPTTNATTTMAPTTNATTTAPPTTPTPTLPTPTVGNYSVKPDVNSTACLLASFGLRIGFKQNEKYQETNFEPPAEASGICGVNSSELQLVSGNITVKLTFVSDSKKFHLQAINVNISSGSGDFVQGSTNLTLWEATVGSSYMCNKEQNFTITDLLSLYTFSLHVQPFGVKNGLYSTAHECSLDDSSILIPIIVGAALAGLILIVVIAYVIGRRKTHAGYQTL
ncbi:PREDICTED: lysosome-associated membrane glycoprotein 2 isoform X3 [Cyprinodon variegatus]|uniref:Lysosomal-associated membrane protein 2 n=1 Tax=Cyprinodon variegatus TaxID=28743 RepID=A0A3Q2CFV5_CYPVA|nr:PREDICTED: lysosome-associated membrane glycoprotein 2 isoform X3 [Cyprinodon variegatus]